MGAGGPALRPRTNRIEKPEKPEELEQRVVVGGSAGTKRRAAAILSDFGSKAKPGAPSPSGRSSSACSRPSRGVVERKAKRGRTLGRLVPQEGLELDTAVSSSAGKRRRDDDDRNDRNSKRGAVMRVCMCMAGEGSGSDLGAGGSGNGAGGGEMEYDRREAGIGASAGMESDMGRSGQIGGGGKRGVLM
jgi:hypothetical protein